MPGRGSLPFLPPAGRWSGRSPGPPHPVSCPHPPSLHSDTTSSDRRPHRQRARSRPPRHFVSTLSSLLPHFPLQTDILSAPSPVNAETASTRRSWTVGSPPPEHTTRAPWNWGESCCKVTVPSTPEPAEITTLVTSASVLPSSTVLWESWARIRRGPLCRVSTTRTSPTPSIWAKACSSFRSSPSTWKGSEPDS